MSSFNDVILGVQFTDSWENFLKHLDLRQLIRNHAEQYTLGLSKYSPTVYFLFL